MTEKIDTHVAALAMGHLDRCTIHQKREGLKTRGVRIIVGRNSAAIYWGMGCRGWEVLP